YAAFLWASLKCRNVAFHNRLLTTFAHQLINCCHSLLLIMLMSLNRMKNPSFPLFLSLLSTSHELIAQIWGGRILMVNNWTVKEKRRSPLCLGYLLSS